MSSNNEYSIEQFTLEDTHIEELIELITSSFLSDEAARKEPGLGRLLSPRAATKKRRASPALRSCKVYDSGRRCVQVRLVDLILDPAASFSTQRELCPGFRLPATAGHRGAAPPPCPRYPQSCQRSRHRPPQSRDSHSPCRSRYR